MKVLGNDESKLVGNWEFKEGRMQADEVARRIEYLTTHSLVKRGVSQYGWESLYEDPNDGRLWELTYPHSEMHGGGPPELRTIDRELAQSKYGFLS